ncbi:S8 family serine peptidase [Algoriphagus namhaensis]|uniref:S8 family serine peptidase n=1 Tax=Algoriphagus namhaensis TaxID=915353 RepID=A0ABV8AML9_9BACT
MRLLFTLCCLILSSGAFAQNTLSKEQQLKEARKLTEQKLRVNLSQFTYAPKSIDESKFSFLNADGGMMGEDGIVSRIQFLDETGWPVINFTNSNVDAAITTGAIQLQPGGDLGLDLTGKGLTVGIFDQTRPKVDHVEYGGRLTQVDGSTETLSTHSTHVSGTIMGQGVNAAAKGMANEATAWSFNWDNDANKMTSNAYDPETKPNGMLLSNHSYSIGMGWEGSNWLGNPSISTEEDWRFGFYSTLSAAMDQVMFSKPYYLPVFAAGNDRSDRGDGTRPPDGPSDILAWRAVSKNGLTIGAVEKVLDYQNPQSVVMSSFSSWGPTDDGRIKPDLVAMGVNVFSASINSNGGDSYASQSGTSMAAPNVTGSLFLLQQLYSERNAGRFMLSSTVKALAIHTTKEAGPAPGPDYMNGWGLLDVASGAQIILDEDGSSKIIREDILGNGESFEFEFVSDGITPIKATLVWTDPEGAPAGTGLDPTDIMLVNDLDMRIFDEDGQEFFPWTLNPALAASATGINTADNFRDNVEKIEINSPKAQKYRVVISHKGDLEFGLQQYALVFTAGTIDGADETLYWIGEDGGSWNSPANWSTTANGSSANRIPGSGTRVVFEGASGGSQEVLFTESAEAFSVNFFGNQLVKFNLQNNEIVVTNGFRVSNQITEIQNGALVFEGSGNNELLVELGLATFSDVDLKFESGNWKVISANVLDNVAIDNAVLNLGIGAVSLSSLTMSANAKLSGNVTSIDFSDQIDIQAGAELKEGLSLVFDGSTGTFKNEAAISFEMLEVTSGQLDLSTGGFMDLNISEGQVRMQIPTLSVRDFNLGPNALLNLGNAGNFEATGELSSNATSGNRARIVSPVTGTFTYPNYRKYCFDFLDVNSVNLVGEGIINLGTDAEVTDATGWLQENCEDVLFANFAFQYNCVGAALTFENLSEGAIAEYEWDFDGLGTSTLEEPFFVFDQAGVYTVSLKVSNADGFTMFEQEITVTGNDIVKPNVVANGNVLTSQQPGSSYQWYANGQVIPGATSRSFEVSGDGSYQVAIFDGACNRVSDPVVISAIEEDEPELSRFGVFIGPIPSDDVLNINIANDYTGPIQFQLVDLSGRVLIQEDKSKISQEMEVKMNLPSRSGLYILRINTYSLTLHKKVIKQ